MTLPPENLTAEPLDDYAIDRIEQQRLVEKLVAERGYDSTIAWLERCIAVTEKAREDNLRPTLPVPARVS